MQNYKICIIAGAIIHVVFVILAIAGFINSTDKHSNDVPIAERQSCMSTSEKVNELKTMLDNGLISQEEFDTKKRELMDKM